MYPELEQFRQIKEDYEKRIDQLKDRQKQLEQEKADHSRQYNKMLSKVVYEGDSDRAVELAESKKKRTETTEELKRIKEEIEHLRVSKKDRLNHLVSSLKQGRDREFETAAKHLQAKKRDLLQYRAEYLLLIQQLYDIRKYVQDVDTEFKKAVKPLTHEYEYESLSIPNINLHNPFGKEDPVGILETEVQKVYKTGRLPEWVESYAKE